MKKVKILGRFVKSIGKGVLDAVFPNFTNAIKLNESEFKNEQPELKIDYIRLATMVVTFGLMVLFIADVIDFDKLNKLLSVWKSLLQ